MSGTSADGVDAVLAEFRGSPNQPKWRLLNFESIAYPSNLRKRVIAAGQGLKLTSSEWLELADAISRVHAKAAFRCDKAGEAQIVGCHGQTVYHRPPSHCKKGAGWQVIQAPLQGLRPTPTLRHDSRSLAVAVMRFYRSFKKDI